MSMQSLFQYAKIRCFIGVTVINDINPDETDINDTITMLLLLLLLLELMIML